ncbi:MAG: hypothetical protein COZ06_31365 [Armatimonadetes bacterium CG_4_10_14_3_um_filter_66_18]|nr:MAG: hypothetical protein COS65_25065 [Armatimonadetes bacterium CG06_land_8_20_14_3_00_66_21]PIX37862.1 MAG: hypothetical protein COZ57_32170 [Armatimonadetes bacterium CG_4_8_14_3_um_filter_66_20]PIY38345.1 MAG: hypothetical protein COZ06_31365 [Armatimonadetes bacterium CG_4_10_14_3_um_filter_66_18]PJB60669.1 MAG: hypothetical protein CO096_32680 [Armatimonadetes bacterium CG_4_9_14_3_um_filter_66_14]
MSRATGAHSGASRPPSPGDRPQARAPGDRPTSGGSPNSGGPWRPDCRRPRRATQFGGPA